MPLKALTTILRLDWIWFSINNHYCSVQRLLMSMNVTLKTIVPHITDHIFRLIVAVDIYASLIVPKADVLIFHPARSKHPILRRHHLSGNVKMTDRLAEQTTRLLEMNEVVFVAQQINNDGNDFTGQIANAERNSSFHKIELLLLFAFALCSLLFSFCPDYK